jgi:glycosyltransferase involved in cell wall biosynthesis
MELGPDVLVVMPAFNEAQSVAAVIGEVFAVAPKVRVLVVDDGSADETAAQARAAGAAVITNVFNVGVGGAMRVGFRYGAARGFRALVQVDADGQHDPRDLPRLLAPLEDVSAPQVVIGARFAGAGEGEIAVPRARRLAMRMLSAHLSRRTHVHLTDVTSGYRAHNRAAMELFARTYPADYLADTVESLVIAAEAGGQITQVPVVMRPRHGGVPSQSPARAGLYLVQVTLMLALSILRRRPTRPTRSTRATKEAFK